MNENLKTRWMFTAALAVILGLLIGHYINSHSMSAARAAGGGWETNGVIIGTTTAQNEQIVIVDTAAQNIMLYHSQGIAHLGLTGVRSYKYDILVPTDTSKAKMGNGLNYDETKAYWGK